jgi:hypothetical protein
MDPSVPIRRAVRAFTVGVLLVLATVHSEPKLTNSLTRKL